MNDLTALAVFFACLLATLGLVRACDWLRPPTSREQTPVDPDGGGSLKESRP